MTTGLGAFAKRTCQSAVSQRREPAFQVSPSPAATPTTPPLAQ